MHLQYKKTVIRVP